MTFAAPPLGGQITGEANGFGLRGFELHIPECRLALPTLHFPTLIRTRRNPEMFVEGGRAPMSSGAVAGFAQVPLAATAAPASPPSAPASPDQPPPTSTAPPSPRCAPPYSARHAAVPLVPGIGNEYGANDAVSDELEQTRKQLAEVREQLNRLTQAAAAMEEATNASARRARQTGPVRIQSDESEVLPEQSGEEIPEPPVTSRRRNRPQQAAVVRSQSPVVPAGGFAEPAPRATASGAAPRRGAAVQAAVPAARPAKRFGHAPYNPGSFGR